MVLVDHTDAFNTILRISSNLLIWSRKEINLYDDSDCLFFLFSLSVDTGCGPGVYLKKWWRWCNPSVHNFCVRRRMFGTSVKVAGHVSIFFNSERYHLLPIRVAQYVFSGPTENLCHLCSSQRWAISTNGRDDTHRVRGGHPLQRFINHSAMMIFRVSQ